MIGSFLTRGLVMIFGYAYPAYECFKTVEKNKPDVEQLRFWCQYWIVVAALAVCERIGDIFISWVPMYGEAKLAFYIYLWYPKTKGTMYVYDSFVKPYIAAHETEIDRSLMEIRTRAGDMAIFYFQKAAGYGQTRVFEIMQFLASQPFPRPYQNQPQQQGPKQARQPTVEEEPPSPTSSNSSSQHEEEVKNEVSTSPAPSAVAPASPVLKRSANKLTSASTKSIQLSPKKRADHSNNLESPENSALKTTTPEPPQNTGESANEEDPEQTEAKSTSPPQETVMEDAIRVTRSRLRKSRSVVKKDD